MKGFALLWSKMLDSSLWVKESKEGRLVWITILMMKDGEGCVYASEAGLAHRARVEEEECHAALERFLRPDAGDTSGVKNGIRLEKIQGGWKVVNDELYRYSTEERRLFWRQQKALQRERVVKKGRGKPSTKVEVAPEDRWENKPPVGEVGVKVDEKENEQLFQREGENGLAGVNAYMANGTPLPREPR
jgi:hypothetical protein